MMTDERVAELEDVLERVLKHMENLSTYHYPDKYLDMISSEVEAVLKVKGE